mgnify:CR=1 FL=1
MLSSTRDGDREAAFGADFEAKFDGLADILERGGFGGALAHATGNGRALGNPRAGFIAVNGHGKLHGDKLGGLGVGRKPCKTSENCF